MKTLTKQTMKSANRAGRLSLAAKSAALPANGHATRAKKAPTLFELLRSCPDGDLLAKAIEASRV